MSSPGIEKIRGRWLETDSMAGVGIDPNIQRIPAEIWEQVGGTDYISEGITLFNQGVIDATADFAVDFKVNSNYFQGELGGKALQNTFDYLKLEHPSVLRVCDGKFGDVQHTAEEIAEEIFGKLDADAVVLNPYLGFDGIEAFAKWSDKLVILCVNTSNPSASEIQDLQLETGQKLWQHVLQKSMGEWNDNGNIIPILSATHPENLEGIREIAGETPILLAGVGTQGGSLEKSVPLCLDSEGYGIMISASRSIIYPEVRAGETSQDASRRSVIELRDAINQAKIG